MKSSQGSPSALPDKQLIIWQAAVSKSELDPEDGLYEPISPEFWKAYKNAEGAIDDSVTLRKVNRNRRMLIYTVQRQRRLYRT